jgi:hypothetical protein
MLLIDSQRTCEEPDLHTGQVEPDTTMVDHSGTTALRRHSEGINLSYCPAHSTI